MENTEHPLTVYQLPNLLKSIAMNKLFFAKIPDTSTSLKKMLHRGKN